MKKVTVGDKIKQIDKILHGMCFDDIDTEYASLVIYPLDGTFYVNAIRYSGECADEYGVFQGMEEDMHGITLIEALNNFKHFLTTYGDSEPEDECGECTEGDEEFLCKNGKKYRLVEV